MLSLPQSLVVRGAFAVAAVAFVAAPATTTWYFGVSTQRTNITFESKADLETIVGSTMTLSGSLVTDEKAGTLTVDLTVPVKSLKTGIDKRDEHLQSDGWLDAEKFPNILFTGTGKKKESKDPKDAGTYTVMGTFTMHGVAKPLTIEVKTKRIPDEVVKKAKMEDGDWTKCSTSFSVSLKDHGVIVPEAVGSKVENTWKVSFDAFASTVKGS